MIQLIKRIFGSKPKLDYAKLVKEGATILDVRGEKEYAYGHIKGSINISVDALEQHLNKLEKDKPIITCCAGGTRSGRAKGILESKGFSEVHNGGGWSSLQDKIKS